MATQTLPTVPQTPFIKPTSVMIHGITGSTKTSQAYHLVKMIHQQTGKKFRIIYSDGGGYAPFADSGMIEQGIVDVFPFTNRQYALADIRKLSRGYWRRWVLNNQLYYNYVPGATEYFAADNNCLTTAEEWNGIAGYLIESMTSTAEMLKVHISEADTKVAFKESYKYEEDGELFSGLDRGHYGIIQKEIYARHMRGFSTLPIQWLIWTAQTCLWESMKGDSRKYGPQVTGTASTPIVNSWFDHSFHVAKERYIDIATQQEIEGYVAWFCEHYEVDGLGNRTPYMAKIRTLPELYPALIAKYPYGFCPLDYTKGLARLFETLDELKRSHKR